MTQLMEKPPNGLANHVQVAVSLIRHDIALGLAKRFFPSGSWPEACRAERLFDTRRVRPWPTDVPVVRKDRCSRFQGGPEVPRNPEGTSRSSISRAIFQSGPKAFCLFLPRAGAGVPQRPDHGHAGVYTV